MRNTQELPEGHDRGRGILFILLTLTAIPLRCWIWFSDVRRLAIRRSGNLAVARPGNQATCQSDNHRWVPDTDLSSQFPTA